MARPKNQAPVDLSIPHDLTVGMIDRTACPMGKQQVFLRDAKSPGLRVRITAASAKSFVFEAKLNRNTVRRTIGDVRAWTIDAARAEANRLRVTLDSGLDPRVLDKQREEEAKLEKAKELARAVTVGDAWKVYMAERTKTWRPRTLADHVRMIEPGGRKANRGTRGRGITIPGPIYPLLQVRLVDLTPEVVERWAKTQGEERPTFGRLAWRCLKAFLNWASTEPDYKHLVNAQAASTRKTRESFGKPVARKDALERNQLAAWLKAVRAIENPVVSAVLQVMLLSGARENEVLSLRWSDVNFHWRKIVIKDKVETSREIPLTNYMASLLEPLPRLNEWVFSSKTSASGALSIPSKALEAVCKTAGIEHLTVHGLRRSFGSLAEWLDIPTGIVSQIMGHKPSATAEKHYRIRPIDLLRQHHQRYEDWILEQAQLFPVGEANHGLKIVNA
jgi:integrase